MKKIWSAALPALAVCLGLADSASAQPGEIYAYTINTVIGSYPYGDGGAATKALLSFPFNIAIDSQGAVYIADQGDSLVRKVVAGGITTVAGTPGQHGFSGDGGAATSAQLNNPGSVALDAAGNLFIYDAGNDVIRKVDGKGIITTFAGSQGKSGSTGDGGLATQALLSLSLSGGVVVDPAGNVYFSDYNNSAIREVNATTNIITTFAGTNGTSGSTGDGGVATSAFLNGPAGLTFDSAGNLYIADSVNDTIRMVAAKTNIMSTVAGAAGQTGSTGDGGPATSALLYYPNDVAFDGAGNMYIADANNNKIRMVTPAPNHIISTVAGSGSPGYGGEGAPAVAALLDFPSGIKVDGSGNIYIADTNNSRVRMVHQGTIASFAGASHAQGDGGAASAALLFLPQGLAWDAQGNLYIADKNNNRIRKVSPEGNISTVAGNGSPLNSGDGGPAVSAGLAQPQCVAVDSAGNVYASTQNQVRMVDAHGNISTVANVANAQGFSGDGQPATAAELYVPVGLAVDSANNLYIADAYNHRVRKISGGIISTVAGSGPSVPSSNGTYGGDGGPATNANLAFPNGVGFDTFGNLLIADTSNQCIRRVDGKSGNISTLAGTGTKLGFGGDLGPATSALLSSPVTATSDSAGNVYIADSGNNAIRIVDGLGNISTIAGGQLGFSGDGGPAISAGLDFPWGVVSDSAGNVWVADANNQRVRKLTPSGPLVPGPSSVVNGASFISGGLVPGSIATVFGSRLTNASGINETSGLPLATQFLDVSVKFNGKTNAALFAVDSVNGAEQINFQVPWELAGKSSAVMQVIDNGALSPTVTVPVLPAQPGIFVVQHANNQPVTSANPAVAGEVLLIYCTGLGAVSPSLADGAAGTGKQETVSPTTVTIGKFSAPVSYSGVPSGFVGLYQVNAQVPTGLASGNQPLAVAVSGASSKPVTIAVK